MTLAFLGVSPPPEVVALALVAAFVIALVAIGGVAGARRLYRPPTAWVIRVVAWTAATALLVFALIGTAPVHEIGDFLFAHWLDPTGKPPEDKAAAVKHAQTIARLGLAALALVLLIVPGTWMDVAAATFVALVIAAAWGDYRNTDKVLACTTPTPGAKVDPPCPTATATPYGRPGGTVPIVLQKAKVVAPAEAVHAGAATIHPVLELRDDEARTTRTVDHPYEVTLAFEVPADKLTEDVEIYAHVAGQSRDLLADITAAKTIYVTP